MRASRRGRAQLPASPPYMARCLSPPPTKLASGGGSRSGGRGIALRSAASLFIAHDFEELGASSAGRFPLSLGAPAMPLSGPLTSSSFSPHSFWCFFVLPSRAEALSVLAAFRETAVAAAESMRHRNDDSRRVCRAPGRHISLREQPPYNCPRQKVPPPSAAKTRADTVSVDVIPDRKFSHLYTFTRIRTDLQCSVP